MKCVKKTVRHYWKYQGTDVVQATSSDYDFYTDDEVALLPKIYDKSYGINQ